MAQPDTRGRFDQFRGLFLTNLFASGNHRLHQILALPEAIEQDHRDMQQHKDQDQVGAQIVPAPPWSAWRR